MERTLVSGLAVVEGAAVGRVWLHRPDDERVPRPTRERGSAAEEGRRLDEALERAKAETANLAARAARFAGKAEAAILAAQAALLDDPAILDPARERIASGEAGAEEAYAAAAAEAAELFEAMEDDPYLKERAADVRDVARRVDDLLSGVRRRDLGSLPEGTVLVARDLKPSETVRIDRTKVVAFLTDTGGPSSHSAIIARAMGLVCIVGMGDVTQRLTHGAIVAVDAGARTVWTDPTPETLARVSAAAATAVARRAELKAQGDQPIFAPDGRRIVLAANIGSPKEISLARENGAEAIGLFRTELLYMDGDHLPTEEEQYAAYSEAAHRMDGGEVIVRTLDIGGDKTLPYLELPIEKNPFLGERALRLCLRESSLFKPQLRALLRAGLEGNLKIMFPMVGSLAELRAAKGVLAQCAGELDAEGIPFRRDIPVGVMIEIPAAALVADALAAECAFFSIGTNDLTQYTLAVDRMNEAVAPLYDPMNPAVLRLVRMTIDAAHRAGIPCGMCGELAGKPEALSLLLDYGLDEFSMGAALLPEARRMLGSQ